MDAEQLKQRLKLFAFRCVNVCESLPKSRIGKIIEDQLLRSSFSSAANNRAACRSQSGKQFLAKLNIVVEEIDESQFWLEVILELGLIKGNKMKLILVEVDELVKILSASKNTVAKKLKQS
jgi:four helix bundle protein